MCSFACKAVLVALKYFDILREGSGLYLSLSTLLVEALPTMLTIGLLMRYHGRSAGASRDANAFSLSGIGTSLLRARKPARAEVYPPLAHAVAAALMPTAAQGTAVVPVTPSFVQWNLHE